jgi:hypothetical protein
MPMCRTAEGHQAETVRCDYYPQLCSVPSRYGEIHIAVICDASVRNEAWNSWRYDTGPYDPYGYCHY